MTLLAPRDKRRHRQDEFIHLRERPHHRVKPAFGALAALGQNHPTRLAVSHHPRCETSTCARFVSGMSIAILPVKPLPLPMCDDTVNALVCALARYLGANPDASDTAEGIARWWLLAGADKRSLAKALAWLNERGLIEMIQATDGHVRYRRSDRSAAGDAALRALGVLPGVLPGGDAKAGN